MTVELELALALELELELELAPALTLALDRDTSSTPSFESRWMSSFAAVRAPSREAPCTWIHRTFRDR